MAYTFQKKKNFYSKTGEMETVIKVGLKTNVTKQLDAINNER